MITLLLSWYDEKPEHLARMIDSCDGLVDQVVAVDGAYKLFPGATSRSSDDEMHAVRRACQRIGAFLFMVRPDDVWESEVAKRAYMFRIGARLSTPEDWLLSMDADMAFDSIHTHEGIRERLSITPCDVADVNLAERGENYRTRLFFRALPGITLIKAHWLYVSPQPGGWRYLWHRPDGSVSDEPALDLTDVTVEHYRFERDHERLERAQDYYANRQAKGLENPIDGT
jgi:hypothetical protein